LEQRLVEAARTAVAESQRREAEGFDRLAAAVVAAVQPIVVERQLQAALARRRVVQAAFESP